MSTSIILVLELASKKRRGLCIGLINCGYTTGVASGAVLAGLITPTLGWRVIFWVQAPIALLLGPLLFLTIPKSTSDNAGPFKMQQLLHNLARVDYAGAIALVWRYISPIISILTTASRQYR
jgi:predicted MFS family arabinose efflux permease